MSELTINTLAEHRGFVRVSAVSWSLVRGKFTGLGLGVTFPSRTP